MYYYLLLLLLSVPILGSSAEDVASYYRDQIKGKVSTEHSGLWEEMMDR